MGKGLWLTAQFPFVYLPIPSLSPANPFLFRILISSGSSSSDLFLYFLLSLVWSSYHRFLTYQNQLLGSNLLFPLALCHLYVLLLFYISLILLYPAPSSLSLLPVFILELLSALIIYTSLIFSTSSCSYL